eukprot:6199663-Pleurochrysis_carterae.AAC.1
MEDDIKRYGATTIVSGADRNGEIIKGMPTTSFEAQMRQFNHPGYDMSVPDKRLGYIKSRVHAWCIRLHADFPAAAKLLSYMDSVSALLPSRGSNWSSTAANRDTH